MMDYRELIEKLRTLPQEKQAEVFDFVQFLASRFIGVPVGGEWTNREFPQFSLGHALRGMNDDPVIYTTDDLSEKNVQKLSLVEFLRASPLSGIDLNVERDGLQNRVMDI